MIDPFDDLRDDVRRMAFRRLANPLIATRTRGYLPHWEHCNTARYFVTFRLGDSLPAAVRDDLIRHRRTLAQAKQSGRKFLPVELVMAERLSTRRIEEYLDAGSGECLFMRPELAQIVADALRFWDEKRCQLDAWCVMPNHVHVLFGLFGRETLAKLVGSWKSFTVHRLNKVLVRRGSIWQDETYDHLIRDEAEFIRAVEYIRNNPVKAGLVDWPWVYVRAGLRRG